MADETRKYVLSRLTEAGITDSGFSIDEVSQDLVSRLKMDSQLNSLLKESAIDDPPNFDPRWA